MGHASSIFLVLEKFERNKSWLAYKAKLLIIKIMVNNYLRVQKKEIRTKKRNS